MAQPTSGGLGTRIAAAFRAAFASGADRVVVAGCDIPALSAAEVRAGFAALSPEAPGPVLGPAADGGYYLVALHRAALPLLDALFADSLPWGTPGMRAAQVALKICSLARLNRANLEVLKN